MKWVSIWLAIICIFVFLLQNLFPQITEELVLTHDFINKPWQLITNVFAHADFSHLFYNLFALVFLGLILENLIGTKKLLLLFSITLITTDITSLIFYSAVLGISGIVYGIIGALAILRPRMIVFVFGVPMPLIIAMLIWALMDILGIFYPTGIANASHLAGLVTGMVFGVVWKIKEGKEKQNILPETQVFEVGYESA